LILVFQLIFVPYLGLGGLQLKTGWKGRGES